MTKILWLSPAFNHYKARLLNHLAKENDIELCVIAGSGRKGQGDKQLDGLWSFKFVHVDENKNKFGYSRKIRKVLKNNFINYDWILIPAEKKNLLLFLYSLYLRRKAKKTGINIQLFSYNHPVLKSTNGNCLIFNKWISLFFYRLLNRVVFYTQYSCELAIEKRFISSSKAFWANNTLDNHEILNHYNFVYPPTNQRTILFIGRLIPSKRINIILDYYNQLKKQFDNIGQSICLEIIGDGPDVHFVKKAIEEDSSIIWHGALTDEKEIAPIMKRCSLVFIPGLSGLSVNHALFYGRPYATLASQFHGPEIAYLQNNQNGILLTGSSESDLRILFDFLTNTDQINQFCNAAINKSKEITVNKWVEQIKKALE